MKVIIFTISILFCLFIGNRLANLDRPLEMELPENDIGSVWLEANWHDSSLTLADDSIVFSVEVYEDSEGDLISRGYKKYEIYHNGKWEKLILESECEK